MVKIMIGSNGVEMTSSYSQTVNVHEYIGCLTDLCMISLHQVDLWLVSSYGNVGLTKRRVKVPKYRLI